MHDHIVAAAKAGSRLDLWAHLTEAAEARVLTEVGVFRGHFAKDVLERCPDLSRYIMIDPWRNLDDWNKPANFEQDRFDAIYNEAMELTEFAAEKRAVLRDVTKVAAREIEDSSVDLCYIDGDHTLRGITIDLMQMFSKVKDGGLLGGDDFTKTIWQHGDEFDPTFVCPYAIYFAEAMDVPIYALPHNQFVMVKDPARRFELIDLAGGYTGLKLNEMSRMPQHAEGGVLGAVKGIFKK